MGETSVEQSKFNDKSIRSELPTISRRDFLRFVIPTTLVGASLALEELKKLFYEALIFGLENPKVSDKATLAALKVSESGPGSENPDYRPMADIIKEGISAYSEGNNQPAFFQRSAAYKDPEYYASVVKEFTSESVLPQMPNKVVDKITSSFPPEAYEAFIQSSCVATNFELLFVPGSGFDIRFRKRHPEYAYKNGSYLKLSFERFRLMEQEGKSEMEEMKQWVEEKSKETKKPISTSLILARFLEKNMGNISYSIFDTALFLKFMARIDLDSGRFSPSEFNIQWYKQHIKDEYQGPTYTSTLESETAINLIGKPYHSWNLVALLQFFPPELVRAGGLQRQLSNFDQQSLEKTRADLQTLENLRETEQLLLSYSQNGMLKDGS